MDCPCCVPDLFEMGGDIDCEFEYSASPIASPLLTPAPTAPPTLSPSQGPVTGPSANSSSRTVVDETPAPVGPVMTLPPTVPPVRFIVCSACSFFPLGRRRSSGKLHSQQRVPHEQARWYPRIARPNVDLLLIQCVA